MKYCVYQLTSNGTPFYIGKTFKGSKRLVEHLYSARHRFKHRTARKIERCIANGDEVALVVLKWFRSEQRCFDFERSMIRKFGRIEDGGSLTNHTLGGEGISGWKHTEDARAKMSAAKRGNKINVGRKRPDFADKWKKECSVYDEDGNRLGTFQSLKDACTEFGVHKASASNSTQGKTILCTAASGKRIHFKYGDAAIVLPRDPQQGNIVIQMNMAGHEVARWPNAKQASEQLGLDAGAIRDVCRGRMKSHPRNTWRWQLAQP